MAMYTYRIVGFLDDTFLQKSPTFLSIGKTRDQGAGVMNSIMMDYFSTPTSIEDRRSTRSILLTAAAPAWTKLTLWFDNSKMVPQDLWLKISPNNYTRLFSIIELCELQQNASTGYINSLLQTDPLYSDIYVKDSLLMSSKRVPLSVALSITEKVMIPEWFQFNVRIVQADDLFEFTFKIYVGAEAFSEGYDITSITRVVPPCNPANFFNTPDWSSNMDAVIKSISFGSVMLDEAIASTDQQGLHAYFTKYVLDAEHYYRVPFQILHRGPKPPSSLDCRKAIKDYLIDLGYTNEDGVRAKFPELFIDCQFYLIPLWNKFTERPERNIYTSISPRLIDVYRSMVPYTTASLEVFMSKAQIILNAQNEMFTVAYPNDLNSTDIQLQDLFPTYMAYSTHSLEFEYMDPNDKEFARQLIKAFSLLNGALTTPDTLITIEDGKKYITFTAGRSEFHVLSKESYTERE